MDACGPGRPPHYVVGESMSVRILVVEDELELADFVVRGLREEGFTVAHAADGELAWRRCGSANGT